MDYAEIINRMGYFRNQAKISQRELSLQLGMNRQFLFTIENKAIELKVKTLLEFCDAVGISIFDFFYLGENYNPEHKEFLDLFRALPDSKKDIIIATMKSMK